MRALVTVSVFVDLLVIFKVVLPPVSFILLVARPAWGRVFTGALFLTYGACGFAMPLLSDSRLPTAWVPNASGGGEGPIISMFFFFAGLALVLHKRIAQLLQGPAPSRQPE